MGASKGLVRHTMTKSIMASFSSAEGDARCGSSILRKVIVIDASEELLL
jgi:hypothetical protein